MLNSVGRYFDMSDMAAEAMEHSNIPVAVTQIYVGLVRIDMETRSKSKQSKYFRV